MCLIHVMYMFTFTVFVNEIYVYRLVWMQKYLLGIMAFCLIPPLIYDATQLKKQGLSSYFSDPWNYFDIIHIYGGLFNVLIHIGDVNYNPVTFDEKGIPSHPEETISMVHGRKVLIITLIMMLLLKTFFFMRIFHSMAHLVSMMKQVMVDLKAFMSFFFILSWIMALIIAVLEVGNFEGS